MLRIIEIMLCYWAQGARRGGLVIALAFLTATGFAGWYAANTLTVNPDTTKMLAADLDFQKTARELRDAFPQLKEELSIIIRAPTLDEVDGYAADLDERLKLRKDLVTETFSNVTDPFLRENGLLYLSERDLEVQLKNLTQAAGLIEKLYQSPDIDTLFSTLAENDSLAANSDLGTQTLDDIYAKLADTIEKTLAGTPEPFSWRGTLRDEIAPTGGYLRIFNVKPVPDEVVGIQPVKFARDGLREELDKLNAEYGNRTTALITGNYALRGEELASVSKGIGFSFLLSFFMVFILLMFAFRSLYVSILTLIGLIITITLTSAFAAWWFTELNLISVAFTVLLIGLGLDFFIHLLLHVQEYRSRGLDRRVALNSTMREIGGAMALAAPTTSLAFFSFLPTSFAGIAQLGAVAGVGVLIAFFVSITFLPAALAIAPPPRPKPQKETEHTGKSFFEVICIPIAIVVVIAGIFAISYLPKARFDADPMSLRDPRTESVRAFNMLFDDPNTYPYRLTRLVDNEKEVAATVQKAKELDLVRTTRSLPDFIPEDQEFKLELIDIASGSLAFVFGKEPETGKTQPNGSGLKALRQQLEKRIAEQAQNVEKDEIPNTNTNRLIRTLTQVEDRNDPALLKELQSQIFQFWPNLTASLRDQFNADFIDYDNLPKAVTERYIAANGKWRVDMLPAEDVRDETKLNAYVDSTEALFPDIAGSAIQGKKAGDIIAGSMLYAAGLATIVITIILLVFVQNPLRVAMILFPLGLAATLTVATSVILDIPFNYANVIVLPLLMGIGVDSGIHLVLRQQKTANGLGKAKKSSVYQTATPRAVFFSALTTVASFGSLILSAHRGTSSMGQLLTIAIAFTLLCTLVVLPAVFQIENTLKKKKTLEFSDS